MLVDPGVEGAIKMLAIDTLHNLYFVWQLIIQVFLVDRVLSGMVQHGHINLEHMEAASHLGSPTSSRCSCSTRST